MDPLMRSHIVEIVQAVPIQNIRKMASPQDDDVIEALTTNAAKIALARCIHKRSPHCRSHDFHSSTLRHLVEFSAELAVVIANDHIGTLAERRDIAKLLRRPLFGRCSRDSDVNDFAGLDVDHEKERTAAETKYRRPAGSRLATAQHPPVRDDSIRVANASS